MLHNVYYYTCTNIFNFEIIIFKWFPTLFPLSWKCSKELAEPASKDGNCTGQTVDICGAQLDCVLIGSACSAGYDQLPPSLLSTLTN